MRFWILRLRSESVSVGLDSDGWSVEFRAMLCGPYRNHQEAVKMVEDMQRRLKVPCVLLPDEAKVLIEAGLDINEFLSGQFSGVSDDEDGTIH